jgi:hypothetical protein
VTLRLFVDACKNITYPEDKPIWQYENERNHGKVGGDGGAREEWKRISHPSVGTFSALGLLAAL